MQWATGDTFCTPCLTCHHNGEHGVVNGVCLACLRLLHTIWTFRGPCIRDVPAYIEQAQRDYGVRAYELLFWVFVEQEQGINAAGQQPVLRHHMPMSQPPPHHRL